jgi:hypothetical protein
MIRVTEMDLSINSVSDFLLFVCNWSLFKRQTLWSVENKENRLFCLKIEAPPIWIDYCCGVSNQYSRSELVFYCSDFLQCNTHFKSLLYFYTLKIDNIWLLATHQHFQILVQLIATSFIHDFPPSKSIFTSPFQLKVMVLCLDIRPNCCLVTWTLCCS